VLLDLSLMVIPAIAAIQLRLPFRRTVLAELSMAIISVIVGLQLSLSYNLASGGAIVLVTIVFFILTTIVARLLPRIKRELPVEPWEHKCLAPPCEFADGKNGENKI
jgi:ABC-type Mn2+/Zn2+ transport system permease subunit